MEGGEGGEGWRYLSRTTTANFGPANATTIKQQILIIRGKHFFR
jgi:hypothetical protein